MLFTGVIGFDGMRVGGPPIPGVTPTGVEPSPMAGGCPSGAEQFGGAEEAPLINGVLKVDVGDPERSQPWASAGNASTKLITVLREMALIICLVLMRFQAAKNGILTVGLQ
jgi:hypothetical protein